MRVVRNGYEKKRVGVSGCKWVKRVRVGESG